MRDVVESETVDMVVVEGSEVGSEEEGVKVEVWTSLEAVVVSVDVAGLGKKLEKCRGNCNKYQYK